MKLFNLWFLYILIFKKEKEQNTDNTYFRFFKNRPYISNRLIFLAYVEDLKKTVPLYFKSLSLQTEERHDTDSPTPISSSLDRKE